MDGIAIFLIFNGIGDEILLTIYQNCRRSIFHRIFFISTNTLFT